MFMYPVGNHWLSKRFSLLFTEQHSPFFPESGSSRKSSDTEGGGSPSLHDGSRSGSRDGGGSMRSRSDSGMALTAGMHQAQNRQHHLNGGGANSNGRHFDVRGGPTPLPRYQDIVSDAGGCLCMQSFIILTQKPLV